MKTTIFILFVWSALMCACDPCEECGLPLEYDATVDLRLINNDSLLKLTDAILDRTDSIQTLDSLNKERSQDLVELNIKLRALTDSIDNGNTSYIGERTAVQDTILQFTALVAEYTDNKDSLTSENQVLSQIRTKITQGYVKVDTAYVLENGQFITYEDTQQVYRLPLILNETQTTYKIVLADSTYSLYFTYETTELVDADRNITIRAFNISPQNSTFDSLIVQCETSECNNGEVQVSAYF